MQRVMAAALVAGAIALGACGGDDDNGTPDAASVQAGLEDAGYTVTETTGSAATDSKAVQGYQVNTGTGVNAQVDLYASEAEATKAAEQIEDIGLTSATEGPVLSYSAEAETTSEVLDAATGD